MLYRTLVAGMLFATISMVAMQTSHFARAQARTVTRHASCQTQRGWMPTRTSGAPQAEAVAVGTSIVNISAGMRPGDTLKMIKLSLEHVHAVDGAIVDGPGRSPAWSAHAIEVAAMALDARRPIIDIAIDGASGERRVLVLRNAVSATP